MTDDDAGSCAHVERNVCQSSCVSSDLQVTKVQNPLETPSCMAGSWRASATSTMRCKLDPERYQRLKELGVEW